MVIPFKCCSPLLWSEHMDGFPLDLTIFLVATFAGGLVGVAILPGADPSHVRSGIGVFLVIYSLYALLRPAMRPVTAGGTAADAGVGFLNGVLAGITGLAGI